MNHDDKPVGGHRPNPSPFVRTVPQEDQAENIVSEQEVKGSLIERLKSKNWKTRCDAYVELATTFSSTESLSAAVFTEHAPNLAKYISDVHPNAQDKALDALNTFLLKSAQISSEQVCNIVSCLIDKCVASTKPNIKEKGLEVLFKLKTSAAETIVIQTITESLVTNKGPKTVIASLQALNAVLSKFGNDAFDIRDVLQTVEKNLVSSANPGIRAEVMNFYKESQKLLKDEIIPYIKSLKPVQQEELKRHFESKEEIKKSVAIKELKVPIKRNIEQMVDEDNKFESQSANKTTGTSESEPESKEKAKNNVEMKMVTENDTMNPMSKFDEAWCGSLLALKQWKEKKDRLDEFVSMCPSSIGPGNYIELINTLKAAMKDANLTVVSASIKALSKLASGLGEQFAQYYKLFFHLIVPRFKDRKLVVDVEQCLEKMVPCIQLEEILEDIKAELEDKSPAIRINLCHWIEKSLMPNASAKSIRIAADSEMMNALIKLTDEANREVRDAVFDCIGIVNALVGQDMPSFQRKIQQLNAQKIEMISRATIVVQEKRGMKIGKPKPQETSYPEPMKVDKEKTVPTAMPKIQPSSIKQEKQEKKKAEESNNEEMKISTSEAEAENKLKETAIAPMMISIDSADWKRRLKGLQDLREWISNNSETSKIMIETIMNYISPKLKDFKESNLSILKEQLVLINTICTLKTSGKLLANMIVPGIIEKVADNKFAETCVGIVLLISDSATPTYVAQKILEKIKGNVKALNLIKGGLILLSKIIKQYSVNEVPIKQVIETTKIYINNQNPAIRSCASSLFCIMYSQTGESIKPIIGDSKDSSFRALLTEFAKIQIKAKEEPKRQQPKAEIYTDASRVNIAAKISSKLIDSLSDPGVKQRQEAKEQLEKIIAEGGNSIQANGLAPLITALKARMQEPCKSLCRGFVAMLGNLASAMGPGCKQYCKILLPALVNNLSDKQAYIKSETISSMNKFAEAAGPEVIITFAGQLLEKDSQDLRLELLDWINKHEEAMQKADNTVLVNGLVSCMQDRSTEVKVITEKVLQKILPIVGIELFQSAIQNLKPTVKEGIVDILIKYSESELNEELAESIVGAQKRSGAPNAIQPMEIGPNRDEENKYPDKISFSDLNYVQRGRPPIDPRKNMTVAHPSPDKSPIGLGSKTKKLTQKGSFKELPAPNLREAMTKAASNSPHAAQFQVINPNINGKVKRAELYQKKLTAKLGAIESKAEYIGMLKNQCISAISTEVVELMFSEDLTKCISALQIFTDILDTGIGIIEILDLVLKWTSHLIEGNSSVELLRFALAFLTRLFNLLAGIRYQLLDFEASPILPVLIELTGTSEKETIKGLIQLSFVIYPPIKVWNFLMRALDSINPLTKIESLVLLEEMVVKFGLRIISPRDIKSFGKFLSNSYNVIENVAIKNQCYSLLNEIYKIKGDAIWTNLGQIPPIVRDELEVVFKPTTEMVLESVSVTPFSLPATNTESLIVPMNLANKQATLPNEENKIIQKVSFIEPATEVKQATGDEDIALQTEAVPEKSELNNVLGLLKANDIGKRFEALAALSKLIEEAEDGKEAMVSPTSAVNTEKILSAFCDTSAELFSKSVKDISLEFLRLFITLFNKLCTMREMLKGISKISVSRTLEQLLTNLLREGIDKMGENGEGETIMKAVNATILRFLENCNPTHAFCALISLYQKNRQAEEKNKLPGIIIKCILKLTKIINTLVPIMDVGELLVSIHEYLLSVQSQAKLTYDEMGTKIVKTIVSELVKVKSESIWEDYKKIESHPSEDTNIKRWIAILLNSFGTNQMSPEHDTGELNAIVSELKAQSSFPQAIMKLAAYKLRHPECDIMASLQPCSSSFAAHVISLVSQCQAKSKPEARDKRNISTKRPVTTRLVIDKSKKLEGIEPKEPESESIGTIGYLTQKIESIGVGAGVSTAYNKMDLKKNQKKVGITSYTQDKMNRSGEMEQQAYGVMKSLNSSKGESPNMKIN